MTLLSRWVITAAGILTLGWPLTNLYAQPILGGQLFATGGIDVQVEVLPADAGFTSELHLFEPPPEVFIALNTDTGTVVNLGSFPEGAELVFGIFVRNTGHTFKMGPGSRNPDGVPHVVVEEVSPGVFNVGFEDLFGGGDGDYDDNIFQFFGGVTLGSSTPTAVPVLSPMSLLLMTIMLIGFGVYRLGRYQDMVNPHINR